MITVTQAKGEEINLLSIKAKSHCSDNENDNENDAKRMHCIGWFAPRRIRTRSFNQ